MTTQLGKAGTGPRKGEQVLCCPHECAEMHWIWFTEPDTITRPDGTKFQTSWVSLCPSCLRQAGTAMSKARRDYTVTRDIVITKRPPPAGARYGEAA